MKNSKLIFVGILLILPVCLMAMAQEATPEKVGIFTKIGEWLKNNAIEMLVVFLGGIGAKHGWTQLLKKIASKGVLIFHSIETVSGSLENLCTKVDVAIKDNGSIDGNSIQDVINSGKGVKTEIGNIIVEFKPKT